jgi:tetratricopeptide (TPR) repeat protein
MFRKLLDRRVPQIVALYVAGAWGFVQFVDWAVGQYGLSPHLVNFVVTALLLLLPSVAWLAWRHGAPGREKDWGLPDGAFVIGNLVIGAGILILAFAGRELGAATTVRLIEDDDGNVVERAVPKAEFRKSLLGFRFERDSGDPDQAWLADGIRLALAVDLAQDPFMRYQDDFHPAVRDLVGEAGIPEGAGVPLPLKHQAAEMLGVDYFLAGDFRAEGDSLAITSRLYETGSARLVAEHEYRGVDPLEIVDRISIDVRRDAGVPEWQIEEGVDLPVRERLTDSPEAFEALAEADRGWRRNEFAEARSYAERAVALDSTAALGHMLLISANMSFGDLAAARASAESLSRFEWRFPERMRLMFRMVRQAFLESDFEGAMRTGRYWAEVFPEDPMARSILADLYSRTGDREAEARERRALLSIDPTDSDAMRSLGIYYLANAQYDSALAVLRRRAARVPTDVRNRIDIANALTNLGDLAGARSELEEARIMAPGDVDLLIRVARLDLREGRSAEAAEVLEDAYSLARRDEDRYILVGIEESIAYAEGRFGQLEELYRERLRLASATRPPAQVVSQMPTSEVLLYATDGGRAEFALAQLDSLRSILEPPFSNHVDQAVLRIHLDLGNVEEARAAVGRLITLRDLSGGRAYDAYILWGEGRIAELENGSCERALPKYDQARRLRPLSWRYSLARARCLRELGRLDEAGEEIGWLRDRVPGYEHVRLEVARYFAARGERDEALAQLDTLLAGWSGADPKFTPADEARALRAEISSER